MGRQLWQVIRERSFGKLSSAERNLVSLMNDLKVLKPAETPRHLGEWEIIWDNKNYVYNRLMEAVQTMNSKTIKPKGVLYAECINGKIVIGFAMCNYTYYDWTKENKAVLKEIAKGRALTWGHMNLENLKIPESIMIDLMVFIERAKRYFKAARLVDWAKEFIGDVEPVEQTNPSSEKQPVQIMGDWNIQRAFDLTDNIVIKVDKSTLDELWKEVWNEAIDGC
jgi:L-2-hydroxyglutarate oxidase LhgO